MNNKIIFYVEESEEGRYEANALGESIYTQGETMDELKKMIRDAVECLFEKGKAPQVIRLHSVHEEVISL